MTALTELYSGVTLNQDATPRIAYPWTGEVFQTFILPSNYGIGTANPVYPDISGFQILVDILEGSADEASISYTLDYNQAGWVNLTQGTLTGAHTDGTKVWFDIILPNPIPVTQAMLSATMRIGITPLVGCTHIYYVNPSPATGCAALQSDSTTPLLGGGTSTSFNFRLLSLVADSGTDFLGNTYRSYVSSSTGANTSTTDGLKPVTGNTAAGYYMSPPQPSRFAVVSQYSDMRSPSNEAVVIDGVMIDPITPNIACNIYYSQDDTYTSDNMTESDWEQKLWIRIPEVFILTQRQQYVFPVPVMAKYIKYEFTNLQSQSYNPGNFQNPVQYKKYPTWVANFFIARVALDPAIAGQVNVQYNALDFAYNYYLDDIQQTPQAPSVPSEGALAQLTNYFTAANSSTGDLIDAATLQQINLVMNSFASPVGTIVDQTSMLGQLVSNLVRQSSSTQATVSEGGSLTPIDYSLVSTLSREPVLFEQSLPVMFFFVTCRHTYKTLSATFEYNRAYFAGINSITCLRNNYTVADDTPMYTEVGGDPINVDTQDWIVDPASGVWSVDA
jgi:hypothetical protein